VSVGLVVDSFVVVGSGAVADVDVLLDVPGAVDGLGGVLAAGFVGVLAAGLVGVFAAGLEPVFVPVERVLPGPAPVAGIVLVGMPAAPLSVGVVPVSVAVLGAVLPLLAPASPAGTPPPPPVSDTSVVDGPPALPDGATSCQVA
jgi:hypothetical protein